MNIGVIYEKDLGPDAEKEGQAIELFNPDDTWQKVEKEDRTMLDQ